MLLSVSFLATLVYELLHNNRTIGADSKEIGEKVKSYYASFCQGEIVVTDIRTAEMTKVVENTYRAVNIAFANELSRICRHDNMDVYEIIKICNMHSRVNILQPGPGVGGHCISVDPWFFLKLPPSLKLSRNARASRWPAWKASHIVTVGLAKKRCANWPSQCLKTNTASTC